MLKIPRHWNVYLDFTTGLQKFLLIDMELMILYLQPHLACEAGNGPMYLGLANTKEWNDYIL